MHCTTSKRPRGLAPLEMVLAIPFLLMIMALMVNIGNVACWKVRALTVARHSIWGNLSPRTHSSGIVPYDQKTGFADPRPDYWPAKNANAGPQDLGNSAKVTDREVPRFPVVRGLSDDNPVLPVGNGKSIAVNADLLNPSRGMRSGAAEMTHLYPMLKRLGNFHLQAATEILDDAWRTAEMGNPNNHFRLNLIYPTFQPPDRYNPVLPVLLQIYNSIYRQGQLALLYGTDPDFMRFQSLYGQPIPYYIDSIRGWTRLNFGCNMDAATVQQAVDDLVDRLQGAKRKVGPLADMSKALKGYYQAVQAKIRKLMQATPPPPNAGQMQADLALLDGYILLLDQFISTL